MQSLRISHSDIWLWTLRYLNKKRYFENGNFAAVLISTILMTTTKRVIKMVWMLWCHAVWISGYDGTAALECDKSLVIRLDETFKMFKAEKHKNLLPLTQFVNFSAFIRILLIFSFLESLIGFARGIRLKFSLFVFFFSRSCVRFDIFISFRDQFLLCFSSRFEQGKFLTWSDFPISCSCKKLHENLNGRRTKLIELIEFNPTQLYISLSVLN